MCISNLLLTKGLHKAWQQPERASSICTVPFKSEEQLCKLHRYRLLLLHRYQQLLHRDCSCALPSWSCLHIFTMGNSGNSWLTFVGPNYSSLADSIGLTTLPEVQAPAIQFRAGKAAALCTVKVYCC